ncbi:MAG: amino acid transporter [Cytophagales bacterium]|nr:amino acid transporter [Armatimonadota bacterium]
MCLTGVDYFSTLGYQPGIAAIAAGALSPFATLILVLLTLFGAVPVYRRVAEESPHGEGSIAMLEHLLLWWKGKLFVLALLGFVATDFIITITLSAADAAAHVTENTLVKNHLPFLHGQEILITLFMVLLLGVVFLKGFKEAIGIAVVLVAVYLVLNAVVVGDGILHLLQNPHAFADWQTRIARGASQGNPLLILGLSIVASPKLALGLSGFETGVAVMPLIKGDPTDTEEKPVGRVRNARKLLITAALIMSVYLLASSLVTTLLIPEAAFQPAKLSPSGEIVRPAGEANGRALAYLAHEYLGEGFGTVYDVSTILILWFAGASAMAGLLNIVPRYLPRYGMAPEWTRATRPLVIIFTSIAVAITILFKANVDTQAGAYATGVLFLMTSAAVAVTISALRRSGRFAASGFGLISLVFAYTTVANIIERPDGIKIAGFFIGAIVLVSLVSRVWRTLELRVDQVEIDEVAQRFISDMAACRYPIHLVANDPDMRNAQEYHRKEDEARAEHRIPENEPVIFFEVYITDPSSFTHSLKVTGAEVGGYHILRAEASAVPNAIAAFLLHLRDATKKKPHAYFNWSEGSPLGFVFRYLLTGEGDTAPVVHEILRRAEPNPAERPAIHAAI